MRSICVFCGSGTGNDPVYKERARRLAELFLQKRIVLVYGGANVGLMKVLADTMLENGGKVIGVMPRLLVEREVAHYHLTEMHIVEDMQERKALMSDLANGFIALPGGYGTMDELFEILAWNQLGMIHKPVGLLNINGYYDLLIRMLDRMVDEKFLRPEHRARLITGDDEIEMLESMENYNPVMAEKWIERLKEGKI
ncbi:MAG: TIGR00730 family Rossman fold protein [Bacteroidota bacterium]|nr:TIGR00730 family Rossman fold protein [Bacteroidota bacterium]